MTWRGWRKTRNAGYRFAAPPSVTRNPIYRSSVAWSFNNSADRARCTEQPLSDEDAKHQPCTGTEQRQDVKEGEHDWCAPSAAEPLIRLSVNLSRVGVLPT